MARTAKRSRPAASFRHSFKVDVYRSKFEPLKSLRHLDVDRLARAARTEIELGHFAGGCCRRVVRAEVRKGRVTRIILEPCAERTGIKKSPEVTRLVKTAARYVMRKRRRPPRFPIPVREFMSNVGTILEETAYCIHLCFLGHCIWCCFYWEGSWGYLDCEGWIVGPFPPVAEL